MNRDDDIRAALVEAADVIAATASGLPARAERERLAIVRRLRKLARRTRELIPEHEFRCPAFSGFLGSGWCGIGRTEKCAGLADAACPLSRGPVVVRRAPC